MSPLPTNEIVLSNIQPSERTQVLDFLQVHYYLEEPLTAGSDPKQPDKEDEEFNLSNIDHGTCVMAVLKGDQSVQKKIVGVILAGPKTCDEAEKLFEEAARLGPTKWGRILHFLACIEQEANVWRRYNVQKVLHIHVMAVDNGMRGQNIGRRLVEAVIDLAKSLNYEMVCADCTSFYSARLMERTGFQCINTKYYRDYVDDTGKQVFTPEEPHDCVKTFVFKL